MKIEESFHVPASLERVWEFIADPLRMASCLPAVESVEVLDEFHYEVIVKQKIGSISATFRIRTEILEKEAPFRMVLSNKGKTILGAAGLLKSTDTIVLQAAYPGDSQAISSVTSDFWTEVRVVSQLTLGGQLAILGAKLIESKSKELFAEATANMKRMLAADPAFPITR